MVAVEVNDAVNGESPCFKEDVRKTGTGDLVLECMILRYVGVPIAFADIRRDRVISPALLPAMSDGEDVDARLGELERH